MTDKGLNEVIYRLKYVVSDLGEVMREDPEITEAEIAFIRNVMKNNLFAAIGALEYLSQMKTDRKDG